MSSQSSSTSSLEYIEFSFKEKMRVALKSAPEAALQQLLGTGISTVTGVPLLSSLLNLKKVRDTRLEIKTLRSLVFEECSCGHCDSILQYAIAQKNKKYDRAKKSSIPIVSYTESARGVIQHFAKAHQGDYRMGVAKTLWCFASQDNALEYETISQAKESCEMAIQIISALVFNDVSGRSYFKTLGLVSDEKGILLIAAGLKSV